MSINVSNVDVPDTNIPDINIPYLVKKYPELEAGVTNNKYDFTKSANQYLMTEVILKEYFNIQINLNRTKLCPRIPNRQEYLRICENLTKEIQPKADWIVDIGTGSSLIYPILGLNINKDNKFIATEINQGSINDALKVINDNHLEPKIKIIKPQDNNQLIPLNDILSIVGSNGVKYTVCNPPFYKDKQDIHNHESFKQSNQNELVISDNELITEGGEVKFITDLINQSHKASTIPQFKNTWFTSQVGIYRHVLQIRHYLNTLYNQRVIKNFAIDEISFNTKRWVVAWNFSLWKPPAFLPSNLNKNEITNNACPNKYNPNHIKDILTTQFNQIKQPNFKYQFYYRVHNLYLMTNELVWNRKVRRNLKFNPGQVKFCTTIIIKFTNTHIILIYGTNSSFVSFINYIHCVCKNY